MQPVITSRESSCVWVDGDNGYVSFSGDTLTGCNYVFIFTDTIKTIGFAADEFGKIWCIDKEAKRLFETFNYDNGPDKPSDGVFRILDEKGKMGYADTLGNIVIVPQYKFAYPFEHGRAKVTLKGREVMVSNEHTTWHSPQWMEINLPQ